MTWRVIGKLWFHLRDTSLFRNVEWLTKSPAVGAGHAGGGAGKEFASMRGICIPPKCQVLSSPYQRPAAASSRTAHLGYVCCASTA